MAGRSGANYELSPTVIQDLEHEIAMQDQQYERLLRLRDVAINTIAVEQGETRHVHTHIPTTVSSHSQGSRTPTSSRPQMRSSLSSSTSESSDDDIPERLQCSSSSCQDRQDVPRGPRLDLRDLEYLDPYDENLNCAICRSAFIEPVIIDCNHVFCRGCLAQSIAHSATCPIDRLPLDLPTDGSQPYKARLMPHIVQNQLDNLRVKCPNSRCEHICARSLIEHHFIVDCPFTKVACPDSKCLKLVVRRLAESGCCLHHEAACDICGAVVELAQVGEHQQKDCLQEQIKCFNCDKLILCHLYDMHLAQCPEAEVHCKFKTVRCAHKGSRKDIGNHEIGCLYGIIQNMELRHQAEKEELKAQLCDTKQQLQKLQDILPSFNQSLQGRGSSTTPPQNSSGSLTAQPLLQGSPRGIPSSPSAMTTPDMKMDYALRTLDVFDAKLENVQRNMGEMEARQAHLVMANMGAISEQLESHGNNLAQLNMYMRGLMTSYRQMATKRELSTEPLTRLNSTENSNPVGRQDGNASRVSPGSHGSAGPTSTLPRRLSDLENRALL
jgi:hypothetical protein